MYTYSIPIMNSNFVRSGRERVSAEIKKAGINRAFLAIGPMKTDKSEQEREFALLADNLGYLKNEGFETGVWLWAFMCSGKIDFTRITGMNLKTSANECCPSDPDFRRFAADYIRDIAKLSPDIILLDDDLRFGHHDCGLGCLCEHHINDMSERCGEKLEANGLAERIFTGGKNKYRDAYIASMGDSLRAYATALREAVDSVNPYIRLGQCACITSWDQEGLLAPELSILLAGKTRPFLRTIGAPYWAESKNWGNRLGDVIDLTRREVKITHEISPEIEVIGEGDVYPRPRYVKPAAYLELFDLALIADGSADGLHKYMLDYYSSAADYEPGYLERHNFHAPDREAIHRIFAGKKPVGVQVYSTNRKLADYELPEKYIGDEFIQNMLFSRSYRFVAGCSLPMTLDGGSAGLVFGEDAKKLPDEALKKPLIIDLHAARILAARAIDTGVDDFGDRIYPSGQHFIEADDYTQVNFGLNSFSIKTAPEAIIYAEYDDKTPSVFEYTNPDGNRFLVLNFRADFDDERFWRNYRLQRIVTDFTAPPVSCIGNPDLYILASRAGDRLSVLLLNISADMIPAPRVCVPSGKPIDFVNCTGRMNGSMLELSTLHAFDHAAFEILLSDNLGRS